MNKADLTKYGALLLLVYEMYGGLRLLANWSPTGCCLLVDRGRLLTASLDDSPPPIYLLDADGYVDCNNWMTRDAERYMPVTAKLSTRHFAKFGWVDPLEGVLELSRAAQLREAGGRHRHYGVCNQTGTGTPGIYMKREIADVVEIVAKKSGDCVTAHVSALHREVTCVDRRAVPPTPVPDGLGEMRGAPVNCKVTRWEYSTPCSRSCGSGIRSNYRRITQKGAFGGAHCPSLHASVDCNTQHCPVDCKFKDSGAKWAPCSKTCGPGLQHRDRQIVQLTEFGGKACGVTTEQRVCGNRRAYSSTEHEEEIRSALEIQSKADPAGLLQAHREHKLAQYLALKVNIPNTTWASCPRDCKLAAWGEWSGCSVTCRSGVLTRRREVLRVAEFGGVCPVTEEARRCFRGPCPYQCYVTDWTPWSQCTKSCRFTEPHSLGSRHRQRRILSHSNTNYTCPDLHQLEKCPEEVYCPIGCKVSVFSAWVGCTASCGTDQATRTRAVRTRPQHGGLHCPHLNETKGCFFQTPFCPVDCVVTPFSEWSVCSASCVPGRSASYQPGSSIKLGEPRLDAAHVYHRVRIRWTPTKVPEQERRRAVVRASAHGGKRCPALQVSRPCNQVPCPIDCTVGQWSEWADSCDVSCQTVSRRRQPLLSPTAGGAQCPSLNETKECDAAARGCIVPCSLLPFNQWGACSVSCGEGGAQIRTRRIPPGDRRRCTAASETRSCKAVQQICPADCVVSTWTPWKPSCPKMCGTERLEQSRLRFIVQVANFGGTCPTKMQAKRKCPCISAAPTHLPTHTPTHSPTTIVDCTHSAWGSWRSYYNSVHAECSVSCGGGILSRYREIVRSTVAGARCSKQSLEKRRVETKECNNFPCRGYSTSMPPEAHSTEPKPQEQAKSAPVVDCFTMDWGIYGPCSDVGGKCLRERVRHIFMGASGGGKACPATKETTECQDTRSCKSEWRSICMCAWLRLLIDWLYRQDRTRGLHATTCEASRWKNETCLARTIHRN
jgi:hypothetical protein